MEKTISYKESIVVFLDVLGFSNKIKTSNSEEYVKSLFEILQFINAWNTSDGKNAFIEEKDLYSETYICSNNLNFSEIIKELQVSYFSDTLVITLPYNDESDLNSKLFCIVCALSNIISKLSMANYFVRGGITIGKMFHKTNMFFGPAYLEAYNLESKAAIYPRIVFSNKLLDFIIKKNMPYIKQAEDGLFYIDWTDYQKKRIQRKLYKTVCDKNYIQELKKIIEENIKENSNDIAIKAKYEWLYKHI